MHYPSAEIVILDLDRIECVGLVERIHNAVIDELKFLALNKGYYYDPRELDYTRVSIFITGER